MDYKWNININQRAAVELELHVDLIDLAIFDYIKSYILSNKCTKVATPEGTFYWVSHKSIQDSMPLLNIKSSQGIINRVNNLIGNGLLIKYSKCEEFGKTLYAMGPNYDRLEFFDTPQENLRVPPTKVEENISLDNNIPPTTLFDNKDSIPKGGERGSDDGFEAAWAAYGRKGNKKSALVYWRRLSAKDRKAIMEAIPLYIAAKPDEKFRKDFSGWINPAYRRWEDKIINDSQQQQSDDHVFRISEDTPKGDHVWKV